LPWPYFSSNKQESEQRRKPQRSVPDVTQQAGIHFVHNNGAFGKKYLPETMGPGVAFIDYDNDGCRIFFL